MNGKVAMAADGSGRRPRANSRYDKAIAQLVDSLRAGTVAGGRSEDQPHLARAAIADRLAVAAERLARAEVVAARNLDGATWQQVGDAFGIIRQSAHERFRAGPDGPRTRPARVRAASLRRG